MYVYRQKAVHNTPLSWLVLIGLLSRDAERANLKSRRAPGLGRNHLCCKREYGDELCAVPPRTKTCIPVKFAAVTFQETDNKQLVRYHVEKNWQKLTILKEAFEIKRGDRYL